MLSEADLLALAGERYGEAVRLARLAGDASNRAYYRLATGGGSVILMVHEEPFREHELPFLGVARYLAGIGAPVPEVLAAYPERGVLILQDLGDTLLQSYLVGRPRRDVESVYREAIDLVALMQDRGTRELTPACVAYHAALDFEKFDWELRFFVQNYVERLMAAPLSAPEDAALRDWLRELARETSGQVPVFCHRDFHSRNLILHQRRLWMFDFQDARWGPRAYDLASLLRDSYVQLPDDLVERLLGYYRELTGVPVEGLHSEFERTALQRNIKALGTFAYQATQRDNPVYLQYVPRTVEYILDNLRKYPSDAAILAIFESRLRYRPADR